MQAAASPSTASVASVGDALEERAASGAIARLPRRTRALRALGVAAAWMLGLLPMVVGWQRCVVATLLHRPCPGCGMTRAMKLLAAGHFEASMAMHPLAVPVALAGLAFMTSTVWTTYATGNPSDILQNRVGRGALVVLAVVYVAALALWIARGLGFFGGPVPV